MGLKPHNWRETEAGLESKCLAPLHPGASEAPLGLDLLCPSQEGCISGVQICTTS